MLEHRDLTERVIGLAIEVHRMVGPGLLESVYETGLCLEFERAGIAFRRQVGSTKARRSRSDLGRILCSRML
jgi:GxxExxY protein